MKNAKSVAHINTPTYELSVVKGTSLTIARDMSLGTLKVIWSKRKTDWDDRLDLDGGPFPIADTERHTNYEAETLEIQLSGSTDNMEYVFGYYTLKMMLLHANPQSFFGGWISLCSKLLRKLGCEGIFWPGYMVCCR